MNSVIDVKFVSTPKSSFFFLIHIFSMHSVGQSYVEIGTGDMSKYNFKSWRGKNLKLMFQIKVCKI